MNKTAKDLLPGDYYKGYRIHSVDTTPIFSKVGKTLTVVVDYGQGSLPRFESFYPMYLERVAQ
jgi:hypothetical protein